MTKLIQQNKLDELEELLSDNEYQRLRREVETRWDDVKRNNIGLEVEDFSKVFPSNLSRTPVGSNNYVDIKVCFVSLTLHPSKPAPNIIRLTVTFSRQYCPNETPSDWIITAFDVDTFKV